MNAATPRSEGPGRVLRWVLIALAAGVFMVCTALFLALPGFGYRTPRVATGDFRESRAHPVAPGDGAGVVGGGLAARHPVALTLYYPRADLPYALSPLEVTVDEDGDLGSLLSQVIHALTRPPEGAGLVAALPPETKLLTYFRSRELLLVNLSPEVQHHSPGGLVSSHATLYALVNSLTTLPGIERVRFFVSNQESLTFREGHSLDRDYRFFPGAVRPVAVPPVLGP